MHTFTIVGKNRENAAKLKQEMQRLLFIHTAKNPDFVVSLGGDGTYLYAERKYPGIPKLLIRDSAACNKCENEIIPALLARIKENKFTIQNHIKLEAAIESRTKKKKELFICTNDFVIRNITPTEALRFQCWTEGKNDETKKKKTNKTYIGDGIVIATPYGSTGYFHSITRKTFTKGIGIAFNNLTKQEQPLILPENETIHIALLRKDAHFAMDNNPKMIKLEEGKTMNISKSNAVAKTITFKGEKHLQNHFVKGQVKEQSSSR